ncbi:MAG TPA: hypothetical protein VN609_06210, partial [Propionibacteriaceae bacterium]|nr:hypothetical protein [Propionibacteriaceae bacterium]
MVNLPRCATYVEGRGQSVVVGGHACLSARYRPRLFAGRIGGTSGAEAGLHQTLPAFSALDLVQNS